MWDKIISFFKNLFSMLFVAKVSYLGKTSNNIETSECITNNTQDTTVENIVTELDTEAESQTTSAEKVSDRAESLHPDTIVATIQFNNKISNYTITNAYITINDSIEKYTIGKIESNDYFLILN